MEEKQEKQENLPDSFLSLAELRKHAVMSILVELLQTNLDVPKLVMQYDDEEEAYLLGKMAVMSKFIDEHKYGKKETDWNYRLLSSLFLNANIEYPLYSPYQELDIIWTQQMNSMYRLTSDANVKFIYLETIEYGIPCWCCFFDLLRGMYPIAKGLIMRVSYPDPKGSKPPYYHCQHANRRHMAWFLEMFKPTLFSYVVENSAGCIKLQNEQYCWFLASQKNQLSKLERTFNGIVSNNSHGKFPPKVLALQKQPSQLLALQLLDILTAQLAQLSE